MVIKLSIQSTMHLLVRPPQDTTIVGKRHQRQKDIEKITLNEGINFFSCLLVSYLLHLFISCFIPQKPEVSESNLDTASPGPAVICPRLAVCLDLKHFPYINLKGQRWKVHCLSEDSEFNSEPSVAKRLSRPQSLPFFHLDTSSASANCQMVEHSVSLFLLWRAIPPRWVNWAHHFRK